MDWKRARRPEQKEERRRAILKAAARLFDTEAWEGLSLNGIAREVGLAKSNLYRYFDSKEAILLELLLSELDGWLVELEDTLATFDRPTEASCSAAIAAAVAQRPRMTALLSLLSAALERNVGPEGLLAFKTRLSILADRFATALNSSLPKLAPDEAGRALLYLHALVTGLWPMSRPTNTLAEILERPEFQAMRIDFASDLERALTALFIGLIQTSQPPRPTPGESHER